MIYINLLPSTIIANGINRSCLIDVEKSVYCLIPNSLADIFINKKQFLLSEMINQFDEEDKQTFIEYIDFLEENHFVLRSDNLIKLKYYDNRSYNSPFEVESMIIDSKNFIDLKSRIEYLNIIPEFLQIRLFRKFSIDELEKIAEILVEKDFLNVELILLHHEQILEDQYINLFKMHKLFSRFFISNYPNKKKLLEKKIICFSEKILTEKECGKISERLFTPNLRTILTSKSCNSCLNKKLSIDNDGNIKNCPSMSQSFGNIKDTTLEEALNQKDFKKYWNITKDEIEVCKDCEFRYICTDCRAYTERTYFEKDIDVSKPLKCGYNPYTNEWEEWSISPLKQNAIEFYNMQDLVKKV